MELHHDISIYGSEDGFKKSLEASEMQIEDPRGIKEEVAVLKEHGSKLKFQYLEQETRDKFLRHVLMKDSVEIGPAEIGEVMEANREAKVQLKAIKTQIDTSIHDGELLAEENIGYLERGNHEQTTVDKMAQEVQSLQQELDELSSQGDSEKYKMLFNFKKLIDVEDIGLSEAVLIAQNVLTEDRLAVGEVEGQISRAEAAAIAAEDLRANLQKTADRYESLLETESENQTAPREPQQEHAHRLRRVNALLEGFL